MTALFATKGDLLVGTGSGTVAKLAAGTDTYLLTADSAQTDGIKWAAAPSASWTWVAKTANYTMTTTDYGVLADATSGALTITLPTAVGATQRYVVKKKDASANAVTIATTSSQTIDGVTTRKLSVQNDTVEVGSDNANWYVAEAALGDVVQLDYAPSAGSDLANGVAMTSGTWLDVCTNQTFTVDDAASLVEVSVGGSLTTGGASSTNNVGSRLVVDSAGSAVTKQLGGGLHAVSFYVNALAGADVVTLTGLAAGSHTVKVQVISTGAGDSLFCRTNTFATTEGLAIRVLERKRW